LSREIKTLWTRGSLLGLGDNAAVQEAQLDSQAEQFTSMLDVVNSMRDASVKMAAREHAQSST
jgi:hypothetical protein